MVVILPNLSKSLLLRTLHKTTSTQRPLRFESVHGKGGRTGTLRKEEGRTKGAVEKVAKKRVYILIFSHIL
jgi:hypothetical protein